MTNTEQTNAFTKWLDTYLAEANIDTERRFHVTGPSGEFNSIPVGVVVEHMKIASPDEQAEIKNIIVKIDFANGDVYHFLNHLAGAIAR